MKGPTEFPRQYTRRGLFNIFPLRRPELRSQDDLQSQPRPTDTLPQTLEEAHRRMNEALEKHLGLRPEQAEIHLMLGDHFAATSVLERVKKDGITVLGGEIRHDQIAFTLDPSTTTLLDGKPYIDRVISRASHPLGSEDPGDHPRKVKATIETVQTLFDSGITFATTDGSAMATEVTTPTNVETLGKTSVKSGVAALALTGALLTLAADRAKQKSIEVQRPPAAWTRGRFIALFATGTGLTAAGVTFRPALTERPEAPPRYDPQADAYFKAQITDEQAALEARTMGLDDAEFATFNERRIKYRNQVMALNMWHSIALNQAAQGTNTAKESYLMTAGSGHIGLAEEFPRGPEELSDELGELADHICGDFLDDLFAAKECVDADPAVEKKPDIGDIRDIIVSAAALFTEPQLISKKPTHVPLLPGNQIPPNARTVFIDRLKRKYEEYASHPTPETKDRMLALNYSLGSLLAQNLDDSNYLRRTLPNVPNDRDVDPSISTLFGPDAFHKIKLLIGDNRRQVSNINLGQGGRGSGLVAHSETRDKGPFRLYLGDAIRMSGRYMPLIRRIDIDSDHDQIIISDGLNTGPQYDVVTGEFVCDRIPPRGNSTLNQVNTVITIGEALTQSGTRMPTASMETMRIATPNFVDVGPANYDTDKRVYEVPASDPLGVQYVVIDEEMFDRSEVDPDKM